MWWLLIPVVIYGAKKAYDSFSEEEVPPRPKQKPKTVLEKNLGRLKRELKAHDGRKVAIIGQPGAGKSSLLIKMTNGEIKPLPVIGVHTDATTWSEDESCNLLNHYNGIVFSDVPGYNTSTHPQDIFESSFPYNSFDAFVFVVGGKIHAADEAIFHKLTSSRKEICIARSKAEDIEDEDMVIQDFQKIFNLDSLNKIIFFSNRTGKGVKAVSKFALSK